jgi:beta-lactam-binding protein with PASTA domain
VDVRAVGLIICSVPVLLCGCFGGGSVVSSPPTTALREVVVPSVRPGYVQDAERAVQTAGLRVVIISIPPISGADGSVNGYAIRGQSPAPGKHVPAGSPVLLRLATSVNGGPGGVGKPGVVPDLVGMHANRAISAATSVGLHVTVPAVIHRVSSDLVTAQSVTPESPVLPDEVITLTVG